MKDYITPAMLIILIIAAIVMVIQDNRSQEPQPDPPAVQETGVRHVGVIP